MAYGHGTYICERETYHWDGKEHLAHSFRVPGATRGHLEVDAEGTIIDIELYKDTCFGVVACYEKTLKEDVKNWIGVKIKIEEVYKGDKHQ